MDNKFDELTKSLAPSVMLRAALKKFDVAPNQPNGIVVVPWSASENTAHFCP